MAALAFATLGATAIAVAPTNVALAATNTSTQAVTATVLAGTLTVTAPPALVTNLTPGSNNTGILMGSLAYTNTLNDGLAWSVTVSSTDWIKTGGGSVLFSNMTVTAGTTITPGVGAAGTPTAGAGGALTGTDTTPGTTQSSAVTLANGVAGAQGPYTQTGSTMAVVVPGTTAQGVYAGTIQYTITG